MAASLKHGLHKITSHGNNKPASSGLPQIDNEKCQQEKQFIADFYNHSKPLAPNQITSDPHNKELGTSSQQLRVQDFELLKTLGTGKLL